MAEYYNSASYRVNEEEYLKHIEDEAPNVILVDSSEDEEEVKYLANREAATPNVYNEEFSIAAQTVNSSIVATNRPHLTPTAAPMSLTTIGLTRTNDLGQLFIIPESGDHHQQQPRPGIAYKIDHPGDMSLQQQQSQLEYISHNIANTANCVLSPCQVVVGHRELSNNVNIANLRAINNINRTAYARREINVGDKCYVIQTPMICASETNSINVANGSSGIFSNQNQTAMTNAFNPVIAATSKGSGTGSHLCFRRGSTFSLTSLPNSINRQNRNSCVTPASLNQYNGGINASPSIETLVNGPVAAEATTQTDQRQHILCEYLNLTESRNLEAFQEAQSDINRNSQPRRILRNRKVQAIKAAKIVRQKRSNRLPNNAQLKQATIQSIEETTLAILPSSTIEQQKDPITPEAADINQQSDDFVFKVPQILANFEKNNKTQNEPERASSSYKFLQIVERHQRHIDSLLSNRMPKIRVVHAIDSSEGAKKSNTALSESVSLSDPINPKNRIAKKNYSPHKNTGRISRAGKLEFMQLRNRKIVRPVGRIKNNVAEPIATPLRKEFHDSEVTAVCRKPRMKSSSTQTTTKVAPLLKSSSSQLHAPIVALTKNSSNVENPLNDNYGHVIHIFFKSNILIVIQETLVSFWQLTNAIKIHRASQTWVSLGSLKRLNNDKEIETPFFQRMCQSGDTPIYLELRCCILEKSAHRQCSMISLYLNTYFHCACEKEPYFKSVSLDTVQSFYATVHMTSVPNSKSFLVCYQESTKSEQLSTTVIKYTLAPRSAALADMNRLHSVKYEIKQLNCVNDQILIGFGQTIFVFWNLYKGTVISTYRRHEEVGRNLGCIGLDIIEHDSHSSYITLVQHVEKSATQTRSELQIVSCEITNKNKPVVRLMQKYMLPSPNFDYNLFGTNASTHFIIQSQHCNDEVWLSTSDQQLNFIAASGVMNYYFTHSDHVVQLNRKSLVVETLTNSIIKLATSGPLDYAI